MKRLIFVVLFSLSLPACGASRVPLNLSPQATAEWHATRAIQSLDTLRNVAIAANATTPPLMAETDTRRVVKYHDSAIDVIHTVPLGWRPIVDQSLTELLEQTPAADRALLSPYVALVRVLVKEIR